LIELDQAAVRSAVEGKSYEYGVAHTGGRYHSSKGTSGHPEGLVDKVEIRPVGGPELTPIFGHIHTIRIPQNERKI
jgi:hypothetical protein